MLLLLVACHRGADDTTTGTDGLSTADAAAVIAGDDGESAGWAVVAGDVTADGQPDVVAGGVGTRGPCVFAGPIAGTIAWDDGACLRDDDTSDYAGLTLGTPADV